MKRTGKKVSKAKRQSWIDKARKKDEAQTRQYIKDKALGLTK